MPAPAPRPELTPADVEFLYGHARAYAGPNADPDRADAYARWYLDQYVRDAATMEDMPAHPHVWPRFLRDWEA